MANMFQGFINAGQQRSDALGQGIGMLAQNYQQKQNQEQAMNYLQQAYELADTDPQASQMAFVQAAQLDPDAVNTLMQVKRAQTPATSASLREFETMIADLPPDEQEKARRIRLGLDPRAVGSSAMTIAETGATEDVAGSEAVIAGARSEASEAGKGRGMAKTSDIVAKAKSDIAKAVKKAEVEGKALGEAQVSYNQATAALPAVEEVVGKLRELAPIATSTFSGRAFNVAAKELGFGATEGAEARAAFTAIVDNQVLPLLKQTFGAAFTVQEMEALKATLGDVNASSAEKMAQLDAFIEGKYRELETKSKEAGIQPKLSDSALKYLEGN